MLSPPIVNQTFVKRPLLELAPWTETSRTRAAACRSSIVELIQLSFDPTWQLRTPGGDGVMDYAPLLGVSHNTCLPTGIKSRHQRFVIYTKMTFLSIVHLPFCCRFLTKDPKDETLGYRNCNRYATIPLLHPGCYLGKIWLLGLELCEIFDQTHESPAVFPKRPAYRQVGTCHKCLETLGVN